MPVNFLYFTLIQPPGDPPFPPPLSFFFFFFFFPFLNISPRVRCFFSFSFPPIATRSDTEAHPLSFSPFFAEIDGHQLNLPSLLVLYPPPPFFPPPFSRIAKFHPSLSSPSQYAAAPYGKSFSFGLVPLLFPFFRKMATSKMFFPFFSFFPSFSF